MTICRDEDNKPRRRKRDERDADDGRPSTNLRPSRDATKELGSSGKCVSFSSGRPALPSPPALES